MMAAGSPVVSLRRRNTMIATTAMTGMVATSRRATYWYSKPGLAPLLLHVPEDGDRGLDHTVDVLPHGGGAVPLAEVDVRRILRHPDRHRLGDRLHLPLVRLARVLIAQALDLLVARPTEHRLVTTLVEEAGHDGIQDVGRDP